MSGKTFHLLLAVTALLALLVAAGCGPQQPGTSEPGTSGSEPQGGQEAGGGDDGGSADGSGPIIIGELAPFTGAIGPFTAETHKAFQAALEEINAAGGPLGRSIEVAEYDTRTTVEAATQGFRQLVFSDGAIALAGPASDEMLALLDLAAENQVPVISPFAGTRELDTRGGNYIYRTAPSDSLNGKAQARMAIDEGFEELVLFYETLEGAQSEAEAFRDAYVELGGTVLREVGLNPGQSTYQSELAEAFSGNPPAAFISAGYETATTVIREWDRRGYSGTWIVSPELASNDFIAAVGADIMEGFYSGTPTEDAGSEAFGHFSEVYQALHGAAPPQGVYASHGYDMLMLYALAIEAAGEATGQAIHENIFDVSGPPGESCIGFEACAELLRQGEEIDYQGASGPVDMDEYSNVIGSFAIIQSQNGEWVQTRLITPDEIDF